MELNEINNAIAEIENVTLGHNSEWLDALKLSASLAVRENDANMLNDDTDFCEMTESEYSKFKASINEEAVFHEDWTIINLKRNVVRRSEKYVNAWNSIVDILLKYDIDKASHRWLETPTDSDVLIDAFCHYDLPKAATVGGSWDLPDAYDDLPDAPDWKFSFSGFSGFIKSVSATDDPNQVKVEYWIYRRNSARGIGFYEFWDSGKALVDINTHRRWVVK